MVSTRMLLTSRVHFSGMTLITIHLVVEVLFRVIFHYSSYPEGLKPVRSDEVEELQRSM
jgi:hypothetical protein